MRSAAEPVEAGWPWRDRIPERVEVRFDRQGSLCVLECEPDDLTQICALLVDECGYVFAGMIVEEGPEHVSIRYVLNSEQPGGWVHVLVRRPLDARVFPSITGLIHAADWHEREAEDLFGIVFDGHPRLGDFVLHNDRWQESLEPMRPGFDAGKALTHREPDLNWRPRRIVQAHGAFAMPIGPVYTGISEPVHFLLETVGEDVIRTIVRLFYKYRAVERIAQGRRIGDALLLAERFAATTAFAHAVGFCQAAERICGVDVPARAVVLRVLFLELERLRHHAGAIHEICESTGLVVATSQAAILEEDMLRICGEFTGHRYLFGLAACGGLTMPIESSACALIVRRAREVCGRLQALVEMLRSSSSFLDRLEGVGLIQESDAVGYGLAGPVARASGVARDLRKIQPYSGYEGYNFDTALESEGDGYARLRILCTEACQSVEIMEQAASALPDGPVLAQVTPTAGCALGWIEAPRGAAFHWLRLGDSGIVERYRIMPPSFANWHGFHVAAENFAFQDFPIILATFGLSVAENDR